MWSRNGKGMMQGRRKKILAMIIGLGAIGVLLTACGGAASAGTTAAQAPADTGHMPAQMANASQKSTTSSSASQYGVQYLAKSLRVSMEVKDTKQAASDLQNWITQTDTQSTSDGTDYEQVSNNQYNVTLTFLITAGHYDQVAAYLQNYAEKQGGTLLSMQESVQDVTNDYIDTQSTLTNLRAEQQRLLAFMSQTQNLNDAVNIEQQLTQVEGQINDIEAHLNQLKGQTSFYTVTITLQPAGSGQVQASTPSGIVSIWQGAWGVVVILGQVLIVIIVWLAAFSVYIIPAGILIWLLRKRPWRKVSTVSATSASSLGKTNASLPS